MWEIEGQIEHAGGTLRARIPAMPDLENDPARLREAQFDAITKLERSLKDNHSRALIQMATGSGKTLAAANICERLIRHVQAKRILFLVDRANLGKQTLKEFRVANVLDGHLALDDVHEVELFNGEFERLSLEPGDCLVVEGNGSISQVGRAAMWRGEITGCVHQNHILRARPLINLSFLLYWMMSPTARDQIQRLASSTSGLYVLPGHKLRQLALPMPGVREQTRIVAAIEEYLSLLDDGVAAMQRARPRMKAFRRAAVDHALSAVSGAKEESGHELFTYVTSGSRGWAKYYSAVGAAFVRVGNVPRDAIQLDLSQVQMVDPPVGAESRRTKVQVGDLLITITADIGRVAVAPADLGEAYINQHVAIARPHVGVNGLPGLVRRLDKGSGTTHRATAWNDQGWAWTWTIYVPSGCPSRRSMCRRESP